MKKKLINKRFTYVALLLMVGIVSFLWSQPVQAQEFPTKPVSVVIPFGPGGSSDLTFRALIGTAQEFLGQPVVLQLKPGGGGAIATEAIAQAKPDGYNLLSGHTSPNSILPAVEGRSRGPDDLAAVCRINIDYGLFLTHQNAPFKTFKEMIAWAKAHPGELSFGVAGTWSITEFDWRGIERLAGIKTRIVPYDGGGQALIGLLGEHIHASLLAVPQSLPQVKAGKLRPLAYEGLKRHVDLPNIPTLKEEGYDLPVLGAWKGVLAPKKTPRPIIDKLATAFKKMTETEQAKTAIKQLGNEFQYLGPDEFEKYWRAEYENYKELGKIFKN